MEEIRYFTLRVTTIQAQFLFSLVTSHLLIFFYVVALLVCIFWILLLVINVILHKYLGVCFWLSL